MTVLSYPASLVQKGISSSPLYGRVICERWMGGWIMDGGNKILFLEYAVRCYMALRSGAVALSAQPHFAGP
jgi:hypothetical protein